MAAGQVLSVQFPSREQAGHALDVPAGVASVPQSARAVRSGSMIPAGGRKQDTGDLAFYSRALARVAALGVYRQCWICGGFVCWEDS